MMLGVAVLAVAVAVAAACLQAGVGVQAKSMATATIDLTDTKPFPHVWKECVGSGHALLGTRADWRAHLQNVTRDIGFKRVRFHGVLDDDMTSTFNDKPSFYNVFQVYDFLLANNVRPLVELSFMPRHLVSCDPSTNCTYAFGNPTGSYKGLIMPPDDFSTWGALVSSFAKAMIDRYGKAEVESWFFEVWNEMWGMEYPFPYLHLYNASAIALKSVSPSLKVGGPATMQVQHVHDFIANTSARGIPVDFVSTHLYPSDPNCNQPSTRHDPNCFAHTLQATQRVAHAANLPLLLTEYNDGLEATPPHRDTAYAAAFVFHNVPLVQNLSLFSWWTFTDIFEEGGMNPSPFSNAFGLQNIYGVAKPVYRAFELLKDAGHTTVATTVGYSTNHMSGSGDGDGIVSVWATISSRQGATGQDKLKSLRVYMSNFLRMDMGSCGNSTVTVNIPLKASKPPSGLKARLYAIDDMHVNPRRAWVQQGSPTYPTSQQLSELFQASEVSPVNLPLSTEGKAVTFSVPLVGCSAYVATFHA